MNRNFTRLVCALAVLILMSVSAAGQVPGNTSKSPLRIDENTADSIVVYDASGEKTWMATTGFWSEPSCRIIVNDKSKPGYLIVEEGITVDFSMRSVSEYDLKTTQVTYEGTRLKSLVYSVEYTSREEINRSDYFYNESGQIISIEIKDEAGNILYQDYFSYNENGDLMSHEWIMWQWTYDGDTDLPIPGTGKIGLIRSQVWEFDSQGRKIRKNNYRNNLVYGGEPLGKSLTDYLIYYYSDGYTPNVEPANNTPIGDANEGGFDLNVNVPADSIASGSVTVTLPEGLTLDETNTTLAVDVAGLFDLTITKQENNSWLIAIKLKPSSKSGALRADEALGTMLHVAYKVEDTLPRGTYNISVNSILFETPFGNMIPEPAIIVPANINRWAVANEQISDQEITAYIADHTLYIGTNQPDEVSIYTVNGVKAYEATVQPGTTAISVATFPQGMLILQGKSGWVKKIVN